MSSHLVIVQDVPKTADHSASRTIFLWRVILEKCIQNLTIHCYDTLSNIKCRIESQILADKVLLDKVSRSDISADPDRYLQSGEKEALEKHKRIISMLRTSEFRIDILVACLRDF